MSLISPSVEARALAARLTWGVLEGSSLTASDRALVRSGLGGIVLFARNVESPHQLRALVQDVRTIAPGPIHIAVDQEGGHIVRIREPLTRFPSAMAIAATRSEQLAHDVAAASARELATLGIDVVLAPDLDVALEPHNPTLGARTFGSDAALVAALGAASVEGFLAGGVLPVAKHVPGHGRTPTDSHLGLPVVRGPGRLLESIDLPPFRAAVSAGVPALMTAHVVYAAVDLLAASVSPRVIARVVRQALAFDGLLVTDALVMDAIAREMAIEDAAVAAISAGADVAMVLEPARRAVDALAAAIHDGRLTPARIRESIQRLDAFAAKFSPHAGDEIIPDAADMDGPWGGHPALARAVADASLTLVRDEGLLPLDPGLSVALVDVGSPAASPVEDAESLGDDATELGRALRVFLPRITTVGVDGRTASGMPRAMSVAASADVVVLATRDAFASAAQRRAVADVLSLDRPVVHVALRSPTDLVLGHPSLVRATIAAYSDVRATCAALAVALVTGPGCFPGRLPMPLPDASAVPPPDPVPVAA